jgi:prepilin-type N-terminal cleavage/methylation domain-containing protein
MKLPTPTRRNSSLERHHRPGQRGFSLTEVMVAGVVGAVIITTVEGMNNISQKAIQESTLEDKAESAVISDINSIRKKMLIYTWCSGQGSVGPGEDTSRCPIPLKDRGLVAYFSPNQNIPVAANQGGDRDKFKTACKDNGSSSNSFLSSLIASIEGQSLPSYLGVTRTVTISDGRAKRLQITYRGNKLNRSLLMTPTVAAWCP